MMTSTIESLMSVKPESEDMRLFKCKSSQPCIVRSRLLKNVKTSSRLSLWTYVLTKTTRPQAKKPDEHNTCYARICKKSSWPSESMVCSVWLLRNGEVRLRTGFPLGFFLGPLGVIVAFCKA